MLFAHDYNDNRVFIDDTQSNLEYYCPYCGVPLITRKGDIRRHHFAHKTNHPCSDSWSHSYDNTEWHYEWQSYFPRANQEIKLTLGETTHRADVMVGRTVIEFQHSIMSSTLFDARNNFYFNLGYKVIWLFDLSNIFAKGQLSYQITKTGLEFYWRNPKKAFNYYDVKAGCTDLFFQLSNNDKQCIVRVTDVSERGFECFETTPFMSKTDFFHYVGLQNGVCAEPDRDDISKNESYLLFKEKYNINLNKQQERALQSIEGATLLLAVPGSGKTTVLVARLGYMIIEKKINPTSILALTFNKDAVGEMKMRFSKKFGEVGNGVSFKTINGFANQIYLSYCKSKDIKQKKLVKDKKLHVLLNNIYKNAHDNKYASESEIKDLQNAISYVKNMNIPYDNATELNRIMPNLSEMLREYQTNLNKYNFMDFDDQIRIAIDILKRNPEILLKIRNHYRYICVDEAQDTSKIQHYLIQLISQGNNLFMVGDEDQSIYGFRGAYPKALLNFRNTYRNPYILRMEHNYRSTPQIIEKAQLFISKNKGRYEKNMVAVRNIGVPVSLIPVKNRFKQYYCLLDIAKKHTEETAFLYRDNESAVVLVDLFLRNNIPFKLRKPEMNFFNTSIVRDIVAYLRLSLNNYDVGAFEQICRKGILYIDKTQQYYVKDVCKKQCIDIYQALELRKNFMNYQCIDSIEKLRHIMSELSIKTTTDAINHIYNNGYDKHLSNKGLDIEKINILLLLAEQEPDKLRFLQRLEDLEQQFRNGFDCNENNPIILSTIHSSKGLEYNTVYMVDIYDGRFPSSRPNILSQSKDNANEEQEERRLFYVGMTRAKNRLFIMHISNKTSSYISELFPQAKISSIPQQKPFVHQTIRNSSKIPTYAMLQIKTQDEIKLKRFAQEKAQKEAYVKEYEACYQDVCDKFTQQTEQIHDHTNRRWIKCEMCGEIKPVSEFNSYGGPGHINSGICTRCRRKQTLQ